MEDAIAGLGRRIAEASRLAVLMHLDAALAGVDSDPVVHAYRVRLAGVKGQRMRDEEPSSLQGRLR